MQNATTKCRKIPRAAVFQPPAVAASRPRTPAATACQTRLNGIPKYCVKKILASRKSRTPIASPPKTIVSKALGFPISELSTVSILSPLGPVRSKNAAKGFPMQGTRTMFAKCVVVRFAAIALVTREAILGVCSVVRFHQRVTMGFRDHRCRGDGKRDRIAFDYGFLRDGNLLKPKRVDKKVIGRRL